MKNHRKNHYNDFYAYDKLIATKNAFASLIKGNIPIVTTTKVRLGDNAL